MIEFKQIIGRGTRLFDGKDYFTIYDFVKAYEHFNDPEWDGEPMEPVSRRAEAANASPAARRRRRRVRAADRAPEANQDQTGGRQGARHPAHDGDELLEPGRQADIGQSDGREAVRRVAANSSRTRTNCDGCGASPTPARRLLERLSERRDSTAPSLDAMRRHDRCGKQRCLRRARPISPTRRAPITRAERAEGRRDKILSSYDEKLGAFLDFVLGEYVRVGDEELNPEKLGSLIELKYFSAYEAEQPVRAGSSAIRDAFIGFQPGSLRRKRVTGLIEQGGRRRILATICRQRPLAGLVGRRTARAAAPARYAACLFSP